MQVAVVFAGEQLISLSLSGDLNYFDATSTAPVKVIQSHQTQCISLAAGPNGSFFSGAAAGDVMFWDSNGVGQRIKGEPHRAKALGLSFNQASGSFTSVGWDDVVRFTSPAGEDGLTYQPRTSALGGQPKDLCTSLADPGLSACLTNNAVCLIRDGAVVGSSPFEDGTCVALSPDGVEIAVGTMDGTVHFFSVDGDSVKNEGKTYAGNGKVLRSLAYSPDGSKLATGDSIKEVCVWDRETGHKEIRGAWVYHTASIDGSDGAIYLHFACLSLS